MSSKLLAHPAALCNMVRRIALDAGKIILTHYDPSGCKYDDKKDGSPVTVADNEAEAFITKALYDLTGDIPIIGEEAAAAGLCPTGSMPEYLWLVDALDGTREFIAGHEDFTVNIALVHKGVPILGVVYAPAHSELYAAHGAKTAIRWHEETGHEKSIHVRTPPAAGLTVALSRFEGSRPHVEAFLESVKVEKTLKRGSSLKFCLIAAGKADVYPRFGKTCEWDTAAGHAVLSGAGGIVTDMNGVYLTYGHGGTWENPGFLAHSGILDFTEALP